MSMRPRVTTNIKSGIKDDAPILRLDRQRALDIFNVITGLGFACSIKHLRGYYFIEVPVRLRGDKAFNAEAEITQLVERAGLRTLQTGMTLRIIGK